MINKRLLAKKDKRETEYIYLKYFRLVYSICLRYMKGKYLAENVLNDSFYKAFSSIDQLSDNEEGNFKMWLCRITINECLIELRKRKQQTSELEESSYNRATFNIAESKLIEEDYLRMIQFLPEKYRTVFNLFAIDGYSHKEIGEMLNISENSSKMRLHYARQELKKMLNHE